MGWMVQYYYCLFTADNKLLDGMNCLFHACISRFSRVPAASMDLKTVFMSPIVESIMQQRRARALESEVPGFNASFVTYCVI